MHPPCSDPSDADSSGAGGGLAALLRDATARLGRIEAGNPRLEAEYLLAAALRLDRARLFLLPVGQPIAPAAWARFESLLTRREAREPLQYILGTVPFCDLELQVGPGVLIPRSETEVLVERVAKALARDRERAALLVDVGTGSGAILLALLHRLPAWRGIGIDRSPEALHWAGRNAGPWRQRLLLVRGDLLEALPPASADAIVSNPPYIRRAEIDALAPEIRDYEPRLALDGGEDGLEPLRRLAAQAARVLRPGGLFAVELAPDQVAEAERLLAASGLFAPGESFDDLAGRSRGVLVRRS